MHLSSCASLLVCDPSFFFLSFLFQDLAHWWQDREQTYEHMFAAVIAFFFVIVLQSSILHGWSHQWTGPRSSFIFLGERSCWSWFLSLLVLCWTNLSAISCSRFCILVGHGSWWWNLLCRPSFLFLVDLGLTWKANTMECEHEERESSTMSFVGVSLSLQALVRLCFDASRLKAFHGCRWRTCSSHGLERICLLVHRLSDQWKENLSWWTIDAGR